MKKIILSTVLALELAAPVFALGAVGATGPGALQAAVNVALQLPVTVAGQDRGWIAVPNGSMVNVEVVQAQQVLIDFAGAQAWVPRAETDVDERLAAASEAQAGQTAADQDAQARRVATYEAQEGQATADLQGKLQNYVSPLERGAYDQQRSVVDYYDWLGRRYNIGVYGQRIYD
jgi:hypothetical protein